MPAAAERNPGSAAPGLDHRVAVGEAAVVGLSEWVGAGPPADGGCRWDAFSESDRNKRPSAVLTGPFRNCGNNGFPCNRWLLAVTSRLHGLVSVKVPAGPVHQIETNNAVPGYSCCAVGVVRPCGGACNIGAANPVARALGAENGGFGGPGVPE